MCGNIRWAGSPTGKGHNYTGDNYTGDNYTGHNYVGRDEAPLPAHFSAMLIGRRGMVGLARRNAPMCVLAWASVRVCAHTRAHACTHAHARTHAQACMQARMHTHARTHACTHTHTHTHRVITSPTSTGTACTGHAVGDADTKGRPCLAARMQVDPCVCRLLETLERVGDTTARHDHRLALEHGKPLP